MNKINWSKPIRHARYEWPARRVASDRKCPMDSNLTNVVLVQDASGTSEIVAFVDDCGMSMGVQTIENCPPPKIKVPYVVYKTKTLSENVYVIGNAPDVKYVKSRPDLYKVLSEGELEVEDKS